MTDVRCDDGGHAPPRTRLMIVPHTGDGTPRALYSYTCLSPHSSHAPHTTYPVYICSAHPCLRTAVWGRGSSTGAGHRVFLFPPSFQIVRKRVAEPARPDARELIYSSLTPFSLYTKLLLRLLPYPSADPSASRKATNGGSLLTS